MTCSVKIIGGLSVATALLGLIVIIMGIVITTSSHPETRCGGQLFGYDQEDKDKSDTAVKIIGLPSLLGGVLALTGGAVGAFGGFKNNKCGIFSEAIVNGIGGGILVVALLGAVGFSAVFADICDNYECKVDSCRATACVQYDDLCCKGCPFGHDSPGGGGLTITPHCKEVVDWMCEMKTKKIVCAIFAGLACVITIVASCCGCGFACCCPQSFVENQIPPAMPGVAGAVVGQPVDADGNKA